MRNCFSVPGECWLCETKAGKISDLYLDNNLKCLPLTPELSRQVYSDLRPGKPTRFYSMLEKLGKF